MRVLHVVPSYYPAVRYGGPIVSVHALCKALARRGYDVHVFTTNVDGDSESDVPVGVPVDMDGVKVWYFPVPFLRRLYWSPRMGQALHRQMASFDVAHTHSVFLYAWTGELGYAGRWVFFSLLTGTVAGVLTFPTAILAQASGRADLSARPAVLSMGINAPLSVVMVLKWGLVVIGTGLALCLISVSLLRAVHAHFGWRFGATLRALATLWVPIAVCACFGALVYSAFDLWFASIEPGVCFARATRVGPGLAALMLYALCLGMMFLVELGRGAFTPEERGRLTRVIPFKWFARLVAKNT